MAFVAVPDTQIRPAIRGEHVGQVAYLPGRQLRHEDLAPMHLGERPPAEGQPRPDRQVEPRGRRIVNGQGQALQTLQAPLDADASPAPPYVSAPHSGQPAPALAGHQVPLHK